MGKHDPRVDAYIRKSADFARPILEYIREVVHAAVPDVEETMKWSFPHFDHNGIMCSMAAFQEPSVFGFWNTPDALVAALKKDKKAQSAFEKLPPSHRHDYIEWITEAKTAGTRQRRLDL